MRTDLKLFIKLMAVSFALFLTIVFLSSCAITGYGCNGRAKCMTRVQ